MEATSASVVLRLRPGSTSALFSRSASAAASSSEAFSERV